MLMKKRRNIGTQIITNMMVPYSLYTYSIWYIKWTLNPKPILVII